MKKKRLLPLGILAVLRAVDFGRRRRGRARLFARRERPALHAAAGLHGRGRVHRDGVGQIFVLRAGRAAHPRGRSGEQRRLAHRKHGSDAKRRRQRRPHRRYNRSRRRRSGRNRLLLRAEKEKRRKIAFSAAPPPRIPAPKRLRCRKEKRQTTSSDCESKPRRRQSKPTQTQPARMRSAAGVCRRRSAGHPLPASKHAAVR